MRTDNLIILITGDYPVYDYKGNKTGKTKFIVSHGIDMETLAGIPLPCVEPHKIGAKYHKELKEWVILK